MAAALAFWAVAMFIAALALPICFAFFRRFPDGGAGFSFALGLLLAGYGYFLLRVASVLPPGRGGDVLAVGLLALVAVGVAGRDRRFRTTLSRSTPAIVAIAGIFTVAFFGYVSFRSYNPQISGTEQPMDFMYLNATIASPEYPPEDPWFAGADASYYYFGYIQAGLLTQVAGVPPEQGYNLALAYTFAAAAAAVASLAAALMRWVVGARGRAWAISAGGLAIVLLLAVGSLSAPFEVAAAHEQYAGVPYETFALEWMEPCAPGQAADCYSGVQHPRTRAWFPTEFWFWWRGTRIIPDTITEFPFFSFLLGDLHPHVMSIPVVLLALAFAVAAWRGRGPLTLRDHMRSPWRGLALAVLLGGLAFQNAWDVITFGGIIAAAVVVRNARAPTIRPPGEPLAAVGALAAAVMVVFVAGAVGFLPAVAALVVAGLAVLVLRTANDYHPRAWAPITNSVAYLAPVAAAALIAYAPWYDGFSSQASGLRAYVGAGTIPAHAFLQFGVVGFAALLVLAVLWRAAGRGRVQGALLVSLWVPVLPFVAWLAVAAIQGDLGAGSSARGAGGWATLVIYGAATWLLAAAAVSLLRARHPLAAPAGLAAAGVLLLYGAELFLIKDVFFGGQPRLNTVFKLSYQAWILLSVAGGVAVMVALRQAGRRRAPAGWLALPVLALAGVGLVYPLTAGANRVCESDPNPSGVLCSPERVTTIDGLADLQRSDPDEYALVKWVRANVPAGATVVEGTGRTWAAGDGGAAVLKDAGVDYGPAARISGRTGHPTPIGWYFHEVQWRGDDAETRGELTRRQDAVDNVYLAPDAATAKAGLELLGAKYLVVGSIEHSRYPAALTPAFEETLDVVFESGNTRVYALPVRDLVQTS